MSIMTLNLNNQEHDFIVQNIPGDGDCGYTAFANWLNLKKQRNFEKEDSTSLRRKLAEYINEHWDQDWTNANGITKTLKEFVKDEITDRNEIKIDLTREDDDTIKEKYCNFIAEPRKLWISHFEFSILEKIFNKKVFIVHQDGTLWSGNASEAAAVSEDSFYTVYNGVHYNLLINIKKYIADYWLKLIKESNMFLHAVASLIKKEAEWLQNKENNILQELLRFLDTQSKEKLTEFYKELGQFFRKDTNNQAKRPTLSPNNSPNPVADMFKFFFDSSPSSDLMSNFIVFFGRMKFLWHKLTVIFNPGLELEGFETSGKYEEYGKYKDIFEIAQEPGRKFYRKLLSDVDNGEKLTDKQFLNKFLHALKHDPQKLFSKNGHDICTALEEIVLGEENNFISNIEQNLQNAFKHYSKDYPEAEKKLLIDTASAYANKLRTEIDQLKTKIINTGETDGNKNKLFQTLQHDRLKLIHFALKMQAFSKGETLTDKKSFRGNFKKYLDKLSAVQEIANLSKELDAKKERGVDIQNDLQSLKVKQGEFSKYHIKPCGIFNLFELQNLENKLNSETKYNEALEKIYQNRSEELIKRKQYVIEDVTKLSDDFKQLCIDFKEQAGPRHIERYDIDNKFTLVNKQLDLLKKQIDDINIAGSVSKKDYDELLSKILSKHSMLPGFKDNLVKWKNTYAGLSNPQDVAAAQAHEAPVAKPQAPQAAAKPQASHRGPNR